MKNFVKFGDDTYLVENGVAYKMLNAPKVQAPVKVVERVDFEDCGCGEGENCSYWG